MPQLIGVSKKFLLNLELLLDLLHHLWMQPLLPLVLLLNKKNRKHFERSGLYLITPLSKKKPLYYSVGNVFRCESSCLLAIHLWAPWDSFKGPTHSGLGTPKTLKAILEHFRALIQLLTTYWGCVVDLLCFVDF